MAEDKLIKTGQFTLPRILFLAVCFALIVGFVAIGGEFLKIGYSLLTLVICGLLFLIAIDYGINLDRVNTSAQAQPANLEPVLTTATTTTPAPEPRVRKRVNRPAKRRR